MGTRPGGVPKMLGAASTTSTGPGVEAPAAETPGVQALADGAVGVGDSHIRVGGSSSGGAAGGG